MILDTMRTQSREPVIIKRVDIPGYFTEDIMNLIHYYNLTTRYGFPQAGGWAEQPAIALDIISTLDNEKDIYRRNKNAS